MRNDISGKFTFSIHKEAEGFVGTVAEDDGSSYWKTENGALRNTEEALSLWIDAELENANGKSSEVVPVA